MKWSGRIMRITAQSACILGHAHLPSPPPPSAHKLFCHRYYITHITHYYILGRFEPLSLSPNDSVAEVALENEALLYAFFCCLCRRNGTRICDLLRAKKKNGRKCFTVVSQNLCFDGDFLQATERVCLQPQQKSFE